MEPSTVPVEGAGAHTPSTQHESAGDAKPRRKAAEVASEVLKGILDENENKENVAPKAVSSGKKKPPKRNVQFLNDLFRCVYASEDSQLIEDDESDVRSLFVDVEWLKDFGSIKKGTICNAVAIDFNQGKFE